LEQVEQVALLRARVQTDKHQRLVATQLLAVVVVDHMYQTRQALLADLAVEVLLVKQPPTGLPTQVVLELQDKVMLVV
jgi:hypothetical protein